MRASGSRDAVERASTRRRSTSSGSRRRDVALRRHRLGRVDRAPAAERDEPVGVLGRGGGGRTPRDLGVRPHAVEAAADRQLDVAPAPAGDEQRAAGTESSRSTSDSDSNPQRTIISRES